MSDFPRQGGKAPATPKPPIKSGVPTQGAPSNPGGVSWGAGGGGTKNNDKNRAK